MPDQLSIQDFAARIKARDSRLAQFPDEELVRKVLERRPELIVHLTAPPSAPRAPSKLTDPEPFASRMVNRIGDAAESTEKVIPDFVNQSRTNFKEGQDQGWKGIPKMLSAIPRAEASTLGSLGSGLYGVSTPGIIQRLSNKEDPANIVADAGLMLAGSGEEPVRGGFEKGARTAADVTGKTAGTPVRILSQEIAGAGKEPVLLDAMKRQKDMAKAASDYAEKLSESRHQKAIADQQMKFGDQLKDNLQQTYQKVKTKLDSRWNQMRSTPVKGNKLTILGDMPGNAVDLKSGIENAETNYLQGSPDSLKQFRDLTGWMERDSEGKIAGGGKVLKPPTWNELRTHYSAMGDAMYGREIPANVFRALRYVRDEVVGGQLREMAEKAGAGEQYANLLKDHARFEDDWKNMSSVTRAGGSPLAAARMAPNAATLIPQITGKTGDLLIERLKKYQDYGASPATAEAIRKAGRVTVPKEPSAPRAAPASDPVAIRRQKLTEAAAKKFSWWDTFPPYLIERLALKNPAFREWVASQPRRETPVP